MPTPARTPQSSVWKVLLPVLVIVLLAVGALFFLKSQANKAPSDAGVKVEVGSILPDFTLNRLSGGSVSASRLGSKITLVSFWATWCDACMEEMPSIVKLRNAYKDRGFEVAAIDVDEKPEAVVPQTMKDLGMEFPVYVDPEGRLGDLFDVHAIPFSVVMNRNRKILMIETGEENWNSDEMRAKLEGWLAK